MCKNSVILEEIGFKYLPEMFPTERSRELALLNPAVYNCEHVVELSMAKVGNMEFVDEAGYDFLPCYSDCKTASVSNRTLKAEVASIENKIGAIRLVVYNPRKEEFPCKRWITGPLDYFFIPKDWVAHKSVACYGTNSYKRRLTLQWNYAGDYYNSFEKFRVKSFEDLATRNDDDEYWYRLRSPEERNRALPEERNKYFNDLFEI